MSNAKNEQLNDAILVSIIIVNYNGKKYLKQCLRSVLEQNYPNFEIIFVDDASTDGSIELLKKTFSNDYRVKIIQNSKTFGPAQTRNIGVKAAKGKYIVFLDNDTEVTPNWLNHLVTTMENDPTIGIAQSTLLNVEDSTKIQHSGLFMIDYCGWTWKSNRDIPYKHLIKNQTNSTIIFAAATAAMIIRHNTLNEVGPFDPKFFIYFEDTDLSWRVWLKGYKIVSIPKSVVYHKEAGSVEYKTKASAFTEYNYDKNCLRMITKNYSLKYTLKFLPTTCVCLFAKALIQMKKTKTGSMIGLIKAFIWNILESKDTIQERAKIQKLRKVSDKYIIKNAMKRLSPKEVFNRI